MREKGLYLDKRVYKPDATQLRILQVVADKPGCHMRQVVAELLSEHSESSVRTGIRRLLAERCLDGGRSNSEILLMLTSGGRMALQRADL